VSIMSHSCGMIGSGDEMDRNVGESWPLRLF
jgi:hypothetical protein